jgi:orotate phosphoribosyltransferase
LRAPDVAELSARRSAMRDDAVLQILESVGAIRKGHFELTSGRHSGTYVQCALVLQHPLLAERLGRALAARFADLHVDVVASPAIGGIVLGQEVARAIALRPGAGRVRALFAERDAQGLLTLRRGFALEPGETVLVIEDVWTTGGSTAETIRVVEECGGTVIAAGALIDRSGGSVELAVRTEALLSLRMESYDAGECPLCHTGEAAVKPGSRFARSKP